MCNKTKSLIFFKLPSLNGKGTIELGMLDGKRAVIYLYFSNN